MLILTRKTNEKIKIGNEITLSIIEIKGEQVKIGVEDTEDEVIGKTIYNTDSDAMQKTENENESIISETSALSKNTENGETEPKKEEFEIFYHNYFVYNRKNR